MFSSEMYLIVYKYPENVGGPWTIDVTNCFISYTTDEHINKRFILVHKRLNNTSLDNLSIIGTENISEDFSNELILGRVKLSNGDLFLTHYGESYSYLVWSISSAMEQICLGKDEFNILHKINDLDSFYLKCLTLCNCYEFDRIAYPYLEMESVEEMLKGD
jgi:hypothetical protein